MASSSNMSPTYRFLDAALTGNLKLFKNLALELCDGDGLATAVASVKDSNGRTALHFAASGGRTRVCKYLIEEIKLDMEMKDGRGETPLHHATLGEHLPTAVYLLEKGADPTAENDKRLTALHYAAEKGLKKFIHLLISKGAVVDAIADSGTPLQFAAAHGRKEALKILLDNSANVRTKTISSGPASFLGKVTGNIHSGVVITINQPNVVFHHIYSPLSVSVLSSSYECVRLLLQAGADPNISSCGVTALGIAASEGEIEIIKCLLKAGANANVTNNYGLTPVEIAALKGNHEGVMSLLPVTSRIPTIPDWSFSGIIRHIHSEEAREQRKLKVKEIFLLSKSKGEEAFKRKDYLNAIYWYTEAINADPSDAAVLSNRSLCWARLNEGSRALSDAQACIQLRPDWPKAYYREGVAWKLLKRFHMASESFLDGLKLDPENKELETAFWEAAEAEMKYMCLTRVM